MAIVLYLIEKTPVIVSFLLVLMIFLCIYPVFHFFKQFSRRLLALILVLICTGLLGWHSWPRMPDNSKKDATQQGPILSPAATKAIAQEMAKAVPRQHDVEKQLAPEQQKTQARVAISKKKSPIKSSDPVPPSQSCPNGICIGGDNNGSATVNNNSYGPPPLTFKWTVEAVPSRKSEFPNEITVVIFPSDVYIPVSLGIVCDSEVGAVEFDFGPNGSIIASSSAGVAADNNKIAYISFNGTAMAPNFPLYVHLWSNGHLQVVQVAKATIKRPA